MGTAPISCTRHYSPVRDASIHITTPYFLPDRSTLAEIVKAVHERGVKVIVLTPGKHADHLFTRASSRRRYGELLKAGAEIYEYQPSMIHVKTMVVDGIWSVVGSTNFDNRSFGLNDEVNLAIRDRDMAVRWRMIFIAICRIRANHLRPLDEPLAQRTIAGTVLPDF